jgi:hypothetical protein
VYRAGNLFFITRAKELRDNDADTCSNANGEICYKSCNKSGSTYGADR